jgi:hypothetical protein
MDLVRAEPQLVAILHRHTRWKPKTELYVLVRPDPA